MKESLTGVNFKINFSEYYKSSIEIFSKSFRFHYFQNDKYTRRAKSKKAVSRDRS
jgi:hypothetical protein